jgi:hypothetical protein
LTVGRVSRPAVSKVRDMVDRDWRICIPEAGHCVAAWLLRLNCGEASVIEPQPTRSLPAIAACLQSLR